jgi:[protein-PII] uridylyltransferase
MDRAWSRLERRTGSAGKTINFEMPSTFPQTDLRGYALTDGDGLTAELTRIAGSGESAERLRPHLLTAVRAVLEDGRAEIRRQFESGENSAQSGTVCVKQTTALMDQICTALFDVVERHVFAAANPTTGEQLSLVAIGGYGRGELSPFSDLDLLFLLPYKQTPRAEQIIEFMLYLLWDLGLKVGHAVRSVEDCIRLSKTDFTIRTSLLETRPIAGQPKLFAELKRRFAKEIVSGTGREFADAKLAERKERHRRLGDSRYLLEPNVKEGKGGLRDLQSLFWIAKYLYQVDNLGDLASRGVFTAEEAAAFAKAQNFLWTVRCHLHYLAGRLEDRLTFDMQVEIGRRMGYTDHAGTLGVERLMKHYFLVAKDVGNLTRVLCAALETDAATKLRSRWFRFSRSKDVAGFKLDGDRLDLRSPRQFTEKPTDTIRIFRVSQQENLDLHPNALRALTRALRLIGPALREDAEANRLFLEILTSRKNPELTLRRMNEAGVLGRFLPDFGRVVAQMQYDQYHAFTVDEHTLFAIGMLHQIEAGALKAELPLASELIGKIGSRRALYVALFFHDLGKGKGGDHSVLGERIVHAYGPRLGLSDEETETAAWLVRHHLDMSDTAFRRDLDDDTTVRAFSELVQSPERLRLLLLLTSCDIRAVGPGRWNNWKATLLAELYGRVDAQLSGSLATEGQERRLRVVHEAIRAALPDFSDSELDEYLRLGYAGYWLSFDLETHIRHARMIRDAMRDGRALDIGTRVDRDKAVTEVTIFTPDHPGLFSELAGAMALSGVNILEARIFTLTNGMALDVFSVQDATGKAFDGGDKRAKLSMMIAQTLASQLHPMQELEKRKPPLASRSRVFQVSPRVLIDNHASTTHTVIEVNARDRIGLLHDVTRALFKLNLQISSAKISTYGQKAVDVFYVKDVFGLKIEHEAKLNQIRNELVAVLADASQPAGRRAAGSYSATERRRARQAKTAASAAE